MPGLNDLKAQVQPITGPASVDAVLAALSPQEAAMVSQGIDPYGSDQGMMQGQPAVGGGEIAPVNEGTAIPTSNLTPQTRAAIGQALQDSLSVLGQPATEADAVAVQSIQNAIMALSGGM